MNYYAKIIQEKRNAQKEPKIFKVFGEPFDISTIGGVERAKAAIERHYKEKLDLVGVQKAMKWRDEIVAQLVKEATKR